MDTLTGPNGFYSHSYYPLLSHYLATLISLHFQTKSKGNAALYIRGQILRSQHYHHRHYSLSLHSCHYQGLEGVERDWTFCKDYQEQLLA